MRCDADMTCKLEAHRGLRVCVPHKFQVGEPLQRPRRMFTTLHYCERHRTQIDVQAMAQDLLSAKVKQSFEAAAKLKWPLGYKCDFERAYVEFVLVTTPEYRVFLASLGHHGIMGAAKLADEGQRKQREALGVKVMAG